MDQLVKKSDLEIILSGAAALQTQRVSRVAIQELEGIGEAEELPMPAVYGVADTLRIPREYVDEYLQIRFPSQERKIRTVNEIGAKPTWECVLGTYGRDLLEELKKASPLERFSEDLGHFYRIKERNEEGFLGASRKKYENQLLAVLSHWNSNQERVPTFSITDPFFAEACKKKIKELQELFSDCKISIECTYPL